MSQWEHNGISCGPIDGSLLTRQSYHRSICIYEGVSESCESSLIARRWDWKFWDFYSNASQRVIDLIDDAGFGGIARFGRYMVDRALVTALVERWRPETHTFHFRGGEATITLQDVAILWGLPIEGEPIIGGGFRHSHEEWREMCEQFLGFRPSIEEIVGNKLMKESLERYLSSELPFNATDDEIVQRARYLILMLIGGLLFSDKSGNLVALRYIFHLVDLKASGLLSWGSGVLAYLYRALCDAFEGQTREIRGPVVLLQIWAWERLPILRPIANVGQLTVIPQLAPYGARWDVRFDLTRLPTHVLITYRDQLYAMPIDQFAWLPYNHSVINSLPEQYVRGSDLWRAKVPLICWEFVEIHMPDRVMRQFGMEQTIPERPNDCVLDLHKYGGRGVTGTDWRRRHRQYVQDWANKQQFIVQGVPADDVQCASQAYMTWYYSVTRRFIGNVAHRQSLPDGFHATGTSGVILANSAQESLEYAQRFLDHPDSPTSRSWVEKIKDSLSRALGVVGDGLGCHQAPGASSTYGVVEPSQSRPKTKILSREVKGHKRGGKRN